MSEQVAVVQTQLQTQRVKNAVNLAKAWAYNRNFQGLMVTKESSATILSFPVASETTQAILEKICALLEDNHYSVILEPGRLVFPA